MLILDDVFNRWSLSRDEQGKVHVKQQDNTCSCEHCGCDSIMILLDYDTYNRINPEDIRLESVDGNGSVRIVSKRVERKFDVSDLDDAHWMFVCAECYRDRTRDVDYRKVVFSLQDNFAGFVDAIQMGLKYV